MCFVLLYNFCPQKFLVLRRIQRDIAMNIQYSRSVCTVPVVIVRVTSNLNCIFDIFSTNTKVPNFVKICPAGGEMFHRTETDRQTDRQTDRHERAKSRVS